MGSDNPTHRSPAVQALGAAARQSGRDFRRSVRRDAEAFRNAGLDEAAIASELDITVELTRRILAVDGVIRCVECAYELHLLCRRSWNDDRTDHMVRCECPRCNTQ